MRARNDDRGALVCLGGFDSLAYSFKVVHIADVLYMPAIALKTRADILSKGQVGVAFDGDMVVIVEVNQLAKLEVTGDRSGFRGDAFHQVAIATNCIDIVIENSVTRAVVAASLEALGDCHA